MSRLSQFLDAARTRVAKGFYTPYGEAIPSAGSLVEALRAHPHPVIAELKPASPSEGRILQGDPQRMLRAYQSGGAAALSILVDEDHFDGHPDLVRAAAFTGLPILWKDFVIDEAQLDAARHHGASAVLLIERCFETAEAREALVQAAHARGLEVLLESFSSADVERARSSAADLHGINARDLDTLDVDVDAARVWVQSLAQAGKQVLALSGIRSRFDRDVAVSAGALGVLVGTHLMASPDPKLWLQALQTPLVKVCGITTEQDLQSAAQADLVGFVVGAPQSPRNLSAMQAERLCRMAKQRGQRTVLVTPHGDDWEVREWVRIVQPDYLQTTSLQPDEGWIHTLQQWDCQWLPALHEATRWPEGAVGIVLDTPTPLGGGSGQTHDVSLHARFLQQHAHKLSLIAGGLDAGNAQDALSTSGAWGVDASSRLEAAPGIKDPHLVQSFIEVAHGR